MWNFKYFYGKLYICCRYLLGISIMWVGESHLLFSLLKGLTILGLLCLLMLQAKWECKANMKANNRKPARKAKQKQKPEKPRTSAAHGRQLEAKESMTKRERERERNGQRENMWERMEVQRAQGMKSAKHSNCAKNTPPSSPHTHNTLSLTHTNTQTYTCLPVVVVDRVLQTVLPIPVHSTNTTKEYFLADKQRAESEERGVGCGRESRT